MASDAVAHLEQRDQVVDVLDLVVRDQNLRVHELAELPFLVVHEVRAYITSVDRETLRELHFVVERLGLLQGSTTSSTNFLVGLGDDAAHEGVAARRDRRDVEDVVVALQRHGELAALLDQNVRDVRDASS